VPNVRCQREDATYPALTQTSQNPSNPNFYPSDARVFVSGHGRAQDNAAIVTDWVNMVRTRYGVARVNLVGYSKGGVDTSYATPYIQGYVANEFLLNSPYAGTPLANFLMDDTGASCPCSIRRLGWPPTPSRRCSCRRCSPPSWICGLTASRVGPHACRLQCTLLGTGGNGSQHVPRMVGRR
jgi:hypothetical protein